MPGLAEKCLCVLSLFHLARARYISNSDNVFLYEKSADAFLSRSLLYNSWDFELVTPGNLERECIEEVCSYEEAREVFEDDQKTADFWKKYTNSSGSSVRTDLPILVSCVLGAVIVAIIVTVLGCYCYKNRGKREGHSVPVQMATDGRSAPELVPLSNIAAPGLPSYNEALGSSGQYDAPPPPYSGETASAPPAPQDEE